MNSYITQASRVNKQCWERDKQTKTWLQQQKTQHLKSVLQKEKVLLNCQFPHLYCLVRQKSWIQKMQGKKEK